MVKAYGRRKNFYEIAEEDYNALETIYNNLKGYSGIGAFSQNTIEKYLKHIMHEFLNADDFTKNKNNEFIKLSKSHNISDINKYLIDNNIDLHINLTNLKNINSYYFTTRYPEEYESLSQEEIDETFELCKDVREKVT